MKISQPTNCYLEVLLEYDTYEEHKPYKLGFQASNLQKTSDSIAAYVRNLFVSESFQIIKYFKDGLSVKAMKSMKSLGDKVSEFDIETENNDPRLRGLVSDLIGNGDIGGRITKAVSTIERFNRWGQHYLNSITRAHQMQLCTNFIDLGLQVYGGKAFFQLQELGGKIFLALPMTKKKVKTYEEIQQKLNYNKPQQHYNQPVVNRPVVPVVQEVDVDNNDYYGGAYGGCFDGSCFVYVLASDGNVIKKNVFDVKKNDFVRVFDSEKKIKFSKVLCVVQISFESNQRLIEFNSTGLKITKKHPIWYQNQWISPIDIVKKDRNIACFSKTTCSVVYNFVLENRSNALIVNDIPCVTFGHGIKEAFHPFYGTSVVIDFLKELPSFEKGLVHVSGSISKLSKLNKRDYLNSVLERNIFAMYNSPFSQKKVSKSPTYQAYRLPSYSTGNVDPYKGIIFEEMNCIIEPDNNYQDRGGLYLGNIEGAALEANISYSPELVSYHKVISADDIHTYNLISNFEEAFQFINSLHCYAGVSRSAAIIIALSFEDAFEYVRERRKIIYPNPGFLKQLREYRVYLDKMNPQPTLNPNPSHYCLKYLDEIDSNQTIIYLPNANFYSQQIISVSPDKNIYPTKSKAKR